MSILALQFIPTNENRSQGPWSDDDYDVILLDSGEHVGRIYGKLAVGGGRQGFWGLGFPHTLNAWKPYYGLVESKAAAKQAFAERCGVTSRNEPLRPELRGTNRDGCPI